MDGGQPWTAAAQQSFRPAGGYRVIVARLPGAGRRVSRPLRCCPGWLASGAGSSLGQGWIAYGSFPSRVEKYRVRSRPQERRETVFSIKIFSLSDKKEW
jgi:hypothetical protein